MCGIICSLNLLRGQAHPKYKANDGLVNVTESEFIVVWERVFICLTEGKLEVMWGGGEVDRATCLCGCLLYM